MSGHRFGPGAFGSRSQAYTESPESDTYALPKQLPLTVIAHHHHHHQKLGEDAIAASTHSPLQPIRAPSISSSVSSSSYAGSAVDDTEDNEIDLLALLTERLSLAFDPIPLDRSLATQAQTSGMLNSKTRELTALQAETAARLAQTKMAFLEGMKAAKEVKADLEYVHKRVKKIQIKTEQKHPQAYGTARARIPLSILECE